MTQVTYIPAPGADKILRAGVIAPWSRVKSRQAAAAARRLAPTDTGELKRSIKASVTADGGVELRADAPHSIMVHEGTNPHTITGNPTLRFHNGEFRNQARHPGTRANPFLMDALEEVYKK